VNGRSVYLVRHGEAASTWGQHADPALSELGRKQAAATADALLATLKGTIPRVTSSPLRRARETADALATRLGCEVAIDDRFREIPSPVPLALRQDWLRGFMRERWSDQEASLHAWRDGILSALEALPGDTIVYTHFLVLNSIVGWVQGRDETLVFWPANASVTVLREAVDGRWSVEVGEQMQTRVN
jgi:probable phosphoglycerate mutase